MEEKIENKEIKNFEDIPVEGGSEDNNDLPEEERITGATTRFLMRCRRSRRPPGSTIESFPYILYRIHCLQLFHIVFLSKTLQLKTFLAFLLDFDIY